MMPQRQTYTAAFRCGKTRYLAHSARAALAAGVAPDAILALTPQRSAAQTLRETLTAATGRQVPTATLRRRAMAILAAAPAAAHLPAGWSPSALLSGIDRRLLLRSAWQQAGARSDSLFATRAASPGALDWVALLFDQLGAWCGTADPAHLPPITPRDSALAELWQAYRGYLQLCRTHGVVAFNEVFGRALDALRQPEVRAASTPRLLLLDDLDLFRPDELLFVAQLIGPGTGVIATTTAPLAGDSPLALERAVAAWAAQHGLEPADADAMAAAPPRVDVAEYGAPDDEVHAIAAQIAALRDETWSSLAVVAFDPELTPLLRRVLPQYGVPVAGAQARDAYALALAPLALAGLRLLAGQALSSHETRALLREPALGLTPGDSRVALSAVEHAHFQPFAPGAGSWPEELSPAGRSRLQQIRAVTADLAVRPVPPSVRLERWLAELGIAERAWQRTDLALEPWAAELDRRHWDRLLGFMRQSEALRAALGAPLAPDEAVEVWTSALTLIEAEGKPQLSEVAIWSPDELGGCSAEHVWLAGLHEGTLPRAQQALPLADDAALAVAFGTLPGFVPPQTDDRAAAWVRGAQLLRRAISRGQQTAHLSYSAAGVDNRRRLPSLLMRELLELPADRHGALEIPPQLRPGIAQAPARSAAPDESQLVEPWLAERPSLQVAPESPLVVTPSAIEDYFNCPRRCFYARELKLWDVASSPRQALGQVVHNALHALLRDAAVLPLSAAYARRLVDEFWIHDEQRWGSKLKQAVFRQLADEAAANVVRYETEQGSGGADYLGGELDLEWRLPDDDVVIRGRLDRIDRRPAGLAIVDYKLGRHNKSIRELLGEFIRPRDDDGTWRPSDIQLPLYALAIEQGSLGGVELRPGEQVRTVAQLYPLDLYTATGKLSSRGVREITIVDHGDPCPVCDGAADARSGMVCRAQLAAVMTDVRGAIDAMRAGRWEPQPREGSKTCNSCNFRPICPDPQ